MKMLFNSLFHLFALKMTAKIDFTKYHGIGNDFILIDNRKSNSPILTSDQSAKLCDRNFGIGADGVIFAMPGCSLWLMLLVLVKFFSLDRTIS
jgi:hypothetical protein